MKKYILFFIITQSIYSHVQSQNYSDYITNKEINDLMIYYVENVKEDIYDNKVKKKRIYQTNVKWHEAFISIFSKDSLNSFDFQFEQIFKSDENYSYNKGLKKIKDFFSHNDIEFFRKQFENEKNIVWYFKSKKSKILKKRKRKYYEFSLPLFNIKRNKAIIFRESFCGSHCGGGRLDLLINNNGKWILYKSIPLFES